MATSYETLYANLLPKFQSYEIPLMTQEEVEELLSDYLTIAISKFHICRKDLFNRDNNAKRFNCDLNEIEIEIISNYMLIAYVNANYVITPTLLKVAVGSSDFKAFSNANQLDKLLSLYNALLAETETLVMRYSWTNRSNISTIIHSNYRKNS